jgi:hypothetical protein
MKRSQSVPEVFVSCFLFRGSPTHKLKGTITSVECGERERETEHKGGRSSESLERSGGWKCNAAASRPVALCMRACPVFNPTQKHTSQTPWYKNLRGLYVGFEVLTPVTLKNVVLRCMPLGVFILIINFFISPKFTVYSTMEQ